MVSSLLKGFNLFRKENYEGNNTLMKRLVKEGQSPDYFIISCIDSRAVPGTIFRAEPGTFFAYKSMGTIVRPYAKGSPLAAALQFALMHNKVKEIIVLGHTCCGAIKALVNEIDDEEISFCINVAQEGLERAKSRCGNTCTNAELLAIAEEEIVLLSVENLKSYPSVATALAEGRVNIRPWIFNLEMGELFHYDAGSKKFIPLTSHKERENA